MPEDAQERTQRLYERKYQNLTDLGAMFIQMNGKHTGRRFLLKCILQ